MLETLDIILRNAATGVFAFLGVLILRDNGFKVGAVLGALSSFTAATYTICTQSWFDWSTVNFFWLVAPFCILGPVHIWLFSLSQFQDDFRLRPYHFAFVALYLFLQQLTFGATEPTYYEGVSISTVSYALVRFFFIGHMVYVAWHGRADDLLEARRKFRGTYIVLVSLMTFVIFVVETFYTFEELQHPLISFTQALSFFTLAFVIFWHAGKVRDGILLVQQSTNERREKAAAHSADLDGADQHDLRAIEKLVAGERLFLEQGLTIAKLSVAAKLPEHRLRRLINQHMGYRNFADFLNRYRIEEAKRLLANAENRHVQVLVIAMDLGYGSLGPFNRAFKARTGQTPTEYRKQALSDADITE